MLYPSSISLYFAKLEKRLIFALSILYEQTTAKARSKLVG